jgi:hypothetical protein
MELENHIKVFGGNPKKQANALAEEINRRIQTRLEKEQLEWQEKNVQPMLKEFIDNVNRDMGEDVKKLFKALSSAKEEFFGNEKELVIKAGTPDNSIDAPDEIAWQAGLAGAGYIAGGVAVAAGAVGLVVLGATFVLPVIAIPTALLAVLARTVVKNLDSIVDNVKDFFSEIKDSKIGFAEKKVKAAVGTQISAQLMDSLLETSEKVAESIDSFTGSILENIQDNMSKEINKVDESFKRALQNRRAKEKSIAEQEAALDAVELQLKKNLDQAVKLSVNIKQGKM